MTPQDMVKITIQAEASKDNTDFVEITHRGTTKKAKVEYGDFRELSKKDDKSEIKDSISCLNLEADTLLRGDPIVLDGITYYVEFFTIVIPGIYNAYATVKKPTGASIWG